MAVIPVPPEPTKEEIEQLRNSTLIKLQSDGLLESLYAEDIKRFKEVDDYLRRFLMHHDNDQKLAMEMAINTLKWRKDVNIYDITEDTINHELLDKGSLDLHNRDIDGCKMLIFTVQLHNKNTVDSELIKKLLIYWIERLEREENGKWITVFFDMRETGIKNMDMNLIQYLIHLFTDYYPWILNYIIVFEMPWMLNAMWKIIKGWLPPKSVEKIKFVDRKTVKTYISLDQCIVGWGGPDNYEFKFISEKKSQATPPPSYTSLSNEDGEVKKVHFDSVHSQDSSPAASSSNREPGEFQLIPSEELVFKSNSAGTMSSITLSNNNSSAFAFKIKTTSPDKYRVRPSVGLVKPNTQIEVAVTLNEEIPPGLFVRDKFLIIAVPCTLESISNSEFTAIHEKTDPVDVFDKKLRVGMIQAEKTEAKENYATSSSTVVSPQFISKIDNLFTSQKVMEEKLNSIRRMLYVVMFLLLSMVVCFVQSTNNLTSTILQTQSSSCAAPPQIPVATEL